VVKGIPAGIIHFLLENDMRYLLLALVLLAGCQAGFESKVVKPAEPDHFYEWRYNPYTGQPIR
jgi:hypothetical protein